MQADPDKRGGFPRVDRSYPSDKINLHLLSIVYFSFKWNKYLIARGLEITPRRGYDNGVDLLPPLIFIIHIYVF